MKVHIYQSGNYTPISLWYQLLYLGISLQIHIRFVRQACNTTTPPLNKQTNFTYATSEQDTVQHFLIKLGIKPPLHILKISIFSLNHVIIRPTKILNNLLKVCKVCTFKITFHIKNHLNLSDFFSVKDVWLGDHFLQMKFFENFDF